MGLNQLRRVSSGWAAVTLLFSNVFPLFSAILYASDPLHKFNVVANIASVFPAAKIGEQHPVTEEEIIIVCSVPHMWQAYQFRLHAKYRNCLPHIQSTGIRASAHERFFAAAAEYFLAVCMDGERNATFSDFLTICQCVRYGFCRVVAVCALLLRTMAKRRKRFWAHPLVSQRLLKGHFHKLYEDLRIHPKKIFGYFRMTCSSFDELSSMIRPKITYRNTVMRASVPPEERLAVTLKVRTLN